MAWSSSSPRKKNWNLAPVIPRTSWCFSAKKVSPVAFDEKQDIMKRVALRLATNIAESGNAKDAETIKNILKKEEISEQDARILDEIYQRNLPE